MKRLMSCLTCVADTRTTNRIYEFDIGLVSPFVSALEKSNPVVSEADIN